MLLHFPGKQLLPTQWTDKPLALQPLCLCQMCCVSCSTLVFIINNNVCLCLFVSCCSSKFGSVRRMKCQGGEDSLVFKFYVMQRDQCEIHSL